MLQVKNQNGLVSPRFSREDSTKRRTRKFYYQTKPSRHYPLNTQIPSLPGTASRNQSHYGRANESRNIRPHLHKIAQGSASEAPKHRQTTQAMAVLGTRVRTHRWTERFDTASQGDYQAFQAWGRTIRGAGWILREIGCCDAAMLHGRVSWCFDDVGLDEAVLASSRGTGGQGVEDILRIISAERFISCCRAGSSELRVAPRLDSALTCKSWFSKLLHPKEVVYKAAGAMIDFSKEISSKAYACNGYLRHLSAGDMWEQYISKTIVLRRAPG